MIMLPGSTTRDVFKFPWKDKLEFSGQCPLTIRYEPCLWSHITSRPLMLDKLEFGVLCSVEYVGALSERPRGEMLRIRRSSGEKVQSQLPGDR